MIAFARMDSTHVLYLFFSNAGGVKDRNTVGHKFVGVAA